MCARRRDDWAMVAASIWCCVRLLVRAFGISRNISMADTRDCDCGCEFLLLFQRVSGFPGGSEENAVYYTRKSSTHS